LFVARQLFAIRCFDAYVDGAAPFDAYTSAEMRDRHAMSVMAQERGERSYG